MFLFYLVDLLLFYSSDHGMEGHGDSPEAVPELHHVVRVLLTWGCLAVIP